MSSLLLVICAVLMDFDSVRDPVFARPQAAPDGVWLATTRIDGRQAIQFVGVRGGERIARAELVSDGVVRTAATISPCDPHWGLPPWAVVPRGSGYTTNETYLIEAAIPSCAKLWWFEMVDSVGRTYRSETVDECGEIETARWQEAIDRMSTVGGGVVKIPKGRHRVGGLFLKSNVTLSLENGAVLEGVADIGRYQGLKLDYVEVAEPWTAVVAAVGVTNVAVAGEGVLFGNGGRFRFNSIGSRPRGMIFYRCRDVRLESITMQDLASWTCYLKECDGVVVRGVKVDSHANMNSDGLDIESCNVLVENCEIDSGDDGICLKSDNPDYLVTNVVVRNCRVRTPCTALKLGTASHGGFRNVRFEKCRVGRPRRAVQMPCANLPFWGYERMRSYPGYIYDGQPTPTVPGIGVENVDGGNFSDVNFSDIDIDACMVPLFVRMGERRHRNFESSQINIPFGSDPLLSGVTIERVAAHAVSATASAIVGVPGFRPTGVMLRDVHCRVKGGCSGEVVARPVPEKANAYPDPCMFDCHVLPAYGLYVRHADNVCVDRCSFACDSSEDPRSEIVKDDAQVIRLR